MKKIFLLLIFILAAVAAIFGTYKAAAFSFGTGQYANIWGSGVLTTPCTSNCNQFFGVGIAPDKAAKCDTDTGSCSGVSQDGSHNDWWVARFVCAGGIGTDGGNHECGGHSNLSILSENWVPAAGGTLDLGPDAQQCGKTIQLDVYETKCRKPDGSWDYAACDDAHMHGYLDFETPACPATTPPVAACGVPCTDNTFCQGASNGCTACLPSSSGGSTCQTPNATPSATPAPGCGISCVGQPASFCQSAPNGCTVCDANSGTCQNPNNPNSNPSGAPQPTTPVTTPTPGFTPDMCSCDGMDSTALFSGGQVTFTAYGKVDASNSNVAYVKDATFTFAKGNELTTTPIKKSDPIAAIQDSTRSDNTKVEYKIPWTINLPQLDPTATYGVWAQLDCAQKTTSYNTQALPQNQVVLGASTQAPQKMGLLDQVLNFFAKLFGQQATTQTTTQNVTPTSVVTPTSTTPTKATVGVQSDESNSQLHLGTTQPLQIVERKACLIKFKVQQ